MNPILKFYSRKDIQKEIFRLAQNREIAVKYGEKGFGKRPDILQYEADILELAKQGVTSFHASIERWKNPLELKPGMTRQQLDNLRTGFDLIYDIDSKFIEYSKLTAELIIESLKFNGIKNISAKFSGGSGIHLAIPFESFPEKVNEEETRLLFPEAPKAIAEYIKNLIKPFLTEKILSLSTLEDISKSLNKLVKELKVNDEFDPFKIIELDSQLISSRHMFRMPFSVNEKSNLVSIPIKISQIKNFKPNQAKIENVEVETKFLDTEKSTSGEANQLFIQAFDSIKKQEIKIPKKLDYEIPKIAIKQDYFPECIKKILRGMKEDGRKRSVFILISFLQNMGWAYEDIQKTILKWNKMNYEPLREGYILSQISWFKRQPKKILPPNCDHESYYKTLSVKCFNCKYKNPVNFVKIKLKEVKNASHRR